MNKIGIMQGRLVSALPGRIQHFPRDHWQDEFELAAQAKLATIEWIWDLHGTGVNPLETEQGVKNIRNLANLHGVEVRSICADYFMERPFLRVTDEARQNSEQKLKWLMNQAGLLGAQRVVLPFVDNSAIKDEMEIEIVVTVLKNALSDAEKNKVELHLETALAPGPFAELLERVSHPLIKVNYDSGNSASLGYRPDDEFDAYGRSIGSVHIKDRVLGGSTVPLTTGNSDFEALFRRLAEIQYAGDFILQVARGQDGDEVAWARKNKEFVEKNLNLTRSWN